MWIVLVVDKYYPSLFPFKTEIEARKFYEENKKEYGTIVHLLNVEDTYSNEDCECTIDQIIDWR